MVTAKSVVEFAAAHSSPRAVIIMVTAGKPIGYAVEELLPRLESGDIIVGGGNSSFTDANRRFQKLKECGCLRQPDTHTIAKDT